MERKLEIDPQGRISRLADAMMVPVMYILSGTIRESPQRTHRWNNIKLAKKYVDWMDRNKMVHYNGVERATSRTILRLPIFHIPILGGWQNYVVFQPLGYEDKWHVGWITEDVSGVSQIPNHGPARALLGPGNVSFFGVTPEGTQIPLQKLSYGTIGEKRPYSNKPFF